MARQPAKVKCTQCTKETPKSEMDLIKNLYVCKACQKSEPAAEKPKEAIAKPPPEEKKEEPKPKAEETPEEEEDFIKDLDDRVDGMLAITRIAKRSESTILNWIRTRDFPARKMEGGIWYSSKSQITKWWNKQLKQR